MINTIIFDIENVLIPFSWEKVYHNLFSDEVAQIIAKATVLDKDL